MAIAPAIADQDRGPTRLRLRVRGAVQGVGFRPFAYGLATQLELGGFVRNGPDGVVVEIEGARAGEFVDSLRAAPPPLARIDAIEVEHVSPLKRAWTGANVHRARYRSVRGLPRRFVRSGKSLLSLSVRDLHALRPALHADPQTPL